MLAIVVPMLAVFPLIGWVQLRRMRPILSCARPSSERISLRDVGRAMKQTYTRKKALMLAAAWLFSGAMQVVTLAVRQHSHPLFGDGLSYLNVFTLVMAVALAAKFIRIAINTKSLATDVAALTPRAG